MGILEEVETATERELVCYLDGASRDGTFSRLHRTLRISQKGLEWLLVLQGALERLGARSWHYREGTRDVWTLETCWMGSCQPCAPAEAAAFARGYFDAEGGVPRSPDARFYVQFVQKDLQDLSRVRTDLESLGLSCGRLHNPSVAVDPHYWRFYIRARSHLAFCESVGSWHPRKRRLLDTFVSRRLAQSGPTRPDVPAAALSLSGPMLRLMECLEVPTDERR